MPLDPPAVLITGMSGVGKSTVLAELARRGHRCVDTDYDGYAVETAGGQHWVESRISALLDEPRSGPLFVAGTAPEQGRFYPRFVAVVLLSVPLDEALHRVTTRGDNPFGRSAADRARIRADHTAVEPLLRAGATLELDGRRPVDELADGIEALTTTTPTHTGPNRRPGRGPFPG